MQVLKDLLIYYMEFKILLQMGILKTLMFLK